MTAAAPDVSVWWDPAAVSAAALAQLRLTDADVDAGRIVAAVGPAGQSINQYLDRDPVDAYTVATAPPQLQDAIVQVTVDLYRRKDARSSNLDGSMMILPPWQPPAVDALSGVRSLLAPFRARRGVA